MTSPDKIEALVAQEAIDKRVSSHISKAFGTANKNN